jgi:MoaA/NifB/PqqE/SkfB family radical SAM enzyme
MRERDFIPRDKMLEIIQEIAAMGVRSVTFSGGGDPFHYPYLLEAVKALAKGGVKFASLTHGARLSGEIAEYFAHCATWLRISIDGWDDKSYSSYRGVPEGEFGRVMANMRNFKSLGGRCYLGVVFIVDKGNCAEVYNFIRMVRDIGADSVKVSPCIVSNSGRENNLYHKQFFGQVKDQVAKAMRDFCAGGFEIFDAYHELAEKFEKEYGWCPYLQITPVIGADLNVYPCHDKAYNLENGLLGSIKDMRFKDFWFSDKNTFFKINPMRDCNNHCVVNANNKMILEYLNADRNHLEFV